MIKKIHKHPLLEQDSKEKLKQVRYRSDLKKALEEIDSCYAVLATRFHAMILGILLGKKVYTVCYSNKINNVIEDNGWEIGHCTIPEFKDIPSEEILNRLEKTDAQDVSDCIEDAQKQFLVLDAYINNINEE